MTFPFLNSENFHFRTQRIIDFLERCDKVCQKKCLLSLTIAAWISEDPLLLFAKLHRKVNLGTTAGFIVGHGYRMFACAEYSLTGRFIKVHRRVVSSRHIVVLMCLLRWSGRFPTENAMLRGGTQSMPRLIFSCQACITSELGFLSKNMVSTQFCSTFCSTRSGWKSKIYHRFRVLCWFLERVIACAEVDLDCLFWAYWKNEENHMEYFDHSLILLIS